MKVFDKMLENLQDEEFVKEIKFKLENDQLNECNFKTIDELTFLNDLSFEEILKVMDSLEGEE